MKVTATHSRLSPMHPFTRGFVQGMAGMFDIFGVRARPRKRRSPEDDARNLHRDVQRVGDDFRVVFSKIRAALPE